MHPADPENLVARFGACRLARSEWTHDAHLIVGLWHVYHHEPVEALSKLRTGIRQLNDSLGTLNSSTHGYHETVTAAYVRVLSEFCAACPAGMPLADRVSRLLMSTLAEKGVLLRFYSQERLMSSRARADWVEPDLAALGLAKISG